jgi:hypothetical protein
MNLHAIADTKLIIAYYVIFRLSSLGNALFIYFKCLELISSPIVKEHYFIQ